MSVEPEKPPWRRAVFVPLAMVWLACTAINLGKAAHIDDAAHLEIARWIAAHPLHPMQGQVAWGDHPAPIHHLNQPHLFFYLLAAVRWIAGPSLIAAQMLVSAFVALGLAAMHGLWRTLVGVRGEVLGPALLFLGPALVPGQNVMTDVPLLGLWLAFGLLVVRARGEASARYLVLAASVAAMAMLVKYTSLILLPLLAIDVWLRGPRHRQLFGVLAIPIAALGLWSVFNYLDYGGVHLLERPLEVSRFSTLEAIGITFGRAALWIVTLGACVPFAIALVPRLGRRRSVIAFASIAILAIATQCIAPRVEAMRGESIATSIARAIFFVVGIAVLALAASSPSPRSHLVSGALEDDARALTVLRGWLVLGALFVIVLSPFVAVRHVMLVLPPLMLIVARTEIARIDRRWAIAASTITIALGVLLGISDRRWAETYRQAARRHHHEAARGVRTFFVGHWGWQWHAAEQGLLPLEPGITELRPGDRVVRPRLVDQPALDPRLRLVRADAIEPGALDILRTSTERLGYYAVWQGLPYTMSLAPVEVFEILEPGTVEPIARDRGSSAQ